jgi:hypothetical protein
MCMCVWGGGGYGYTGLDRTGELRIHWPALHPVIYCSRGSGLQHARTGSPTLTKSLITNVPSLPLSKVDGSTMYLPAGSSLPTSLSVKAKPCATHMPRRRGLNNMGEGAQHAPHKKHHLRGTFCDTFYSDIYSTLR